MGCRQGASAAPRPPTPSPVFPSPISSAVGLGLLSFQPASGAGGQFGVGRESSSGFKLGLGSNKGQGSKGLVVLRAGS